MRSKKGFAFIETIITVVILSASLLYLYSTYSAILSDEKVRVYYDDPSFIYYTNYVKKFFEEYADLENIKRSKFNDTYVISIGTGYQNLLKDRSMAAALEKIVESFRINHIAIVKSDMFNNCFEGTEEYCESSIKNLNYNMQKYVTSLSDTKYNYYLVVEYAIRLDETTGKQVKCTPTIDKRCQTYYASIGLSGDKYETLANYVISQYGSAQGNNDIYYHNASLTNGAGDNSYRYAGANPNNFVCFGSTESPCPTDNLYRIIGVFGDQVKLIKYDYANSNLLGTDGDYSTNIFAKSDYSTYKGELTTINRYYWNYKNNTSINDGRGSSEWSTSLFNKINLNTNYLNNIGTTWSNMIENTTWKVSGHTTNGVTPKAMYTAEITNATKTYGPSNGTSKIGLMYVSDYGFAAAPSAWTSNMSDYYSSAITSVNWMYMGLYDWTITPYPSYGFDVFSLGSNGFLDFVNANYGYGVRPVLYLKASVAYAGGTGTKDSPITLVV